jgi:hypothetical protein
MANSSGGAGRGGVRAEPAPDRGSGYVGVRRTRLDRAGPAQLAAAGFGAAEGFDPADDLAVGVSQEVRFVLG